MLDGAEEYRFDDAPFELPRTVGHDGEALGTGQQDGTAGKWSGAPDLERGAAGTHPEQAAAQRALDFGGEEVRLASEGGDIAFGRPLVDLARRSELRDLAVLHDGDLVGDRHRLGLVVGDIEGRGAAGLLHVADQPAHVVTQAGVEIGQGLVEQQEPRLDDQRAGQRHALLLAARQLARQAVLEPDKLHLLEHLAHAALALGLAAFAKEQAIADVLRHVEMGKQGVVLEDDAEVALAGRRCEDADAVGADVAIIGIDEARDAAQGRRLAAA
jgi:hypothetical protein